MSKESLDTHIESRKVLKKKQLIENILKSKTTNKSGNKRGIKLAVTSKERKKKVIQSRLMRDVRKVENDE